MPFARYEESTDHYKLEQGLALQRASNPDFIKAWMVYRGLNEDFSQDFHHQRAELEGVPFCFWIMDGARRVAGAILLPNGIGDFFVIPPEDDAEKVLEAVMPLLRHWSNPAKPIGAQAIAPRFVGAFKGAGFEDEESRCWMIRPTEALSEPCESPWRHEPLPPDRNAEIASLLHAAFAGGVGQYGRRDHDAHRKSVDQYFESFSADSDCGQASGVVTDPETGALVGVCMVEMHRGLPTIRFVAVLPGYRSRGMASALMRHSIGALSQHHDWIKLAVTLDNPAIEFYQGLGFISGDPLHQLSIPASA